jgi:hypothetical protein
MSGSVATETPLVIVSTVRRRPGHQQAASPPALRPSHAARTLALAHHLQRAIDEGAINNRSALARRFGLSRVRVTQVLDLLCLAPDLQDIILESQAANGNEPFSERDFGRPLADALKLHET